MTTAKGSVVGSQPCCRLCSVDVCNFDKRTRCERFGIPKYVALSVSQDLGGRRMGAKRKGRVQRGRSEGPRVLKKQMRPNRDDHDEEKSTSTALGGHMSHTHNLTDVFIALHSGPFSGQMKYRIAAPVVHG